MIMQKIGFFRTYSAVLLIQAFLAFTICIAVKQSKYLYWAYCVVSMMCEGAHFSIFPPLSGAIYGPVLQVPVNALFFVGFGVSSMFAVYLFSAVVAVLGYPPLFIILGLMTCCSLVINWFLQYT